MLDLQQGRSKAFGAPNRMDQMSRIVMQVCYHHDPAALKVGLVTFVRQGTNNPRLTLTSAIVLTKQDPKVIVKRYV